MGLIGGARRHRPHLRTGPGEPSCLCAPWTPLGLLVSLCFGVGAQGVWLVFLRPQDGRWWAGPGSASGHAGWTCPPASSCLLGTCPGKAASSSPHWGRWEDTWPAAGPGAGGLDAPLTAERRPPQPQPRVLQAMSTRLRSKGAGAALCEAPGGQPGDQAPFLGGWPGAVGPAREPALTLASQLDPEVARRVCRMSRIPGAELWSPGPTLHGQLCQGSGPSPGLSSAVLGPSPSEHQWTPVWWPMGPSPRRPQTCSLPQPTLGTSPQPRLEGGGLLPRPHQPIPNFNFLSLLYFGTKNFYILVKPPGNCALVAPHPSLKTQAPTVAS